MMAFQDKSYSHDAQSGPSQALAAAYAGTFPLFRMGRARVRAHFTLPVALLLGLLPLWPSFPLTHRITCLLMLVAVVLIRESARARIARMAGGKTAAIVLWPLGGLADPGAPRRPGPTFLAYLAGPLMNAIICAACAGGLYAMHRIVVPANFQQSFAAPGLEPNRPGFYLWYLYVVSFAMLVLNLLPALPLDGGRLLQTMLWRFVGYGRALLVACNAGIAATVFLGTVGVILGQWLLVGVMAICLSYCIQQRLAIKSAGTWTFDEFDAEVGRARRRRHKLSRYRKWKARRQIRLEETDQSRLDEILGKIHDRGLRALSWAEKRVLRRATERQRRSAEP